jgi:hypothetical protein
MKATKLTEKEVNDFNYITLQAGGYFYEACLRKKFLDEGESCVIAFSQFIQFMNKNEVTRPVYASLSYETCIRVTKELNTAIFDARNGLLQETEKKG